MACIKGAHPGHTHPFTITSMCTHLLHLAQEYIQAERIRLCVRLPLILHRRRAGTSTYICALETAVRLHIAIYDRGTHEHIGSCTGLSTPNQGGAAGAGQGSPWVACLTLGICATLHSPSHLPQYWRVWDCSQGHDGPMGPCLLTPDMHFKRLLHGRFQAFAWEGPEDGCANGMLSDGGPKRGTV